MKKLLSVIALVMAALMLVACGGSASSAAPSAPAASTPDAGSAPAAGGSSDGKWKIGVEIQTMTNEWHINYSNELKEFWEAQGAEVLVSSSELDVNKEITDVQNFVSAGCDAIFIIPNSYDGIRDAVQDARAQGVLVAVNCSQEDVPNDCGEQFEHYTFGTYVGDAAADWLIEKGFEKDKVAIITYALTKQELIDRDQGLKDALLAKCPDIQIVAEVSDKDMVNHGTLAETLLLANPDLRAFVCLSDGLSILEVCKANGYNTEDFGIFCSEEGEAQYLALQQDECYRSNIAFSLPGSNLLAPKEILKALQGQDHDNMITVQPGGALTKDNIVQYLTDKGREDLIVK